MENTKVSVIIPVHNTINYLKPCLDSVLAQTYANLEILLVDDASTDGCGELCEEYAKKDQRIRVFHKKEKSGVGGGRNTGIDHATGEFLNFVDSDDMVTPDYIESMVQVQQSTEADIVCARHMMIWEKKKYTKEPEYPTESYEGCEKILIALAKKKLSVVAWANLYRASIFEGLRFPENRIYEDVLTTYRTFCRAKKLVEMPPGAKYYYLQREGSVMRDQARPDKHFAAHLERYEDICRIVQERKLSDEVRRAFFERTVQCCYEEGYRGFWRKDKKSLVKVRQYWREHRKEICALGAGFRRKAYFPHIEAIICGAQWYGKYLLDAYLRKNRED